jgi:hypothetical protein
MEKVIRPQAFALADRLLKIARANQEDFRGQSLSKYLSLRSPIISRNSSTKQSVLST